MLDPLSYVILHYFTFNLSFSQSEGHPVFVVRRTSAALAYNNRARGARNGRRAGRIEKRAEKCSRCFEIRRLDRRRPGKSQDRRYRYHRSAVSHRGIFKRASQTIFFDSRETLFANRSNSVRRDNGGERCVRDTKFVVRILLKLDPSFVRNIKDESSFSYERLKHRIRASEQAGPICTRSVREALGQMKSNYYKSVYKQFAA